MAGPAFSKMSARNLMLGSTARAARTRPSNSELDASLFAPCKPVTEQNLREVDIYVFDTF